MRRGDLVVPIYDMIMLDSTAEIAPMEDGFSWCRGDAELGMVLEVFHNQWAPEDCGYAWVKVLHPSGRTGYCHTDDVEIYPL